MEAVERVLEILKDIGGYEGESPVPAHWQDIVRSLGAKGREAYAILRGSFPEPAPAEQGEGLVRKLESASKALHYQLNVDGDWRRNQDMEAARLVDEVISALLASRPQPEAAKVVPKHRFHDAREDFLKWARGKPDWSHATNSSRDWAWRAWQSAFGRYMVKE